MNDRTAPSTTRVHAPARRGRQRRSRGPAPRTRLRRGKKRIRGATWVTREHVFVDRVACAWLIRRFIDPRARFEFVPWDADAEPLEAEGKIPFDLDSGGYGHRFSGAREKCTFEVLVEEFGLTKDARLARLATLVHAADVEADVDAVPEARGLRAIAWGWRFQQPDDAEAIREGSKLYDALYTWARVRDVQERDAAALAAMSSKARYQHLRRAVAGG